MSIDGQGAIVTGGGSGLGEAVARKRSRPGATVAVLDINQADGRRMADAIDGLAPSCHITDTASVTVAHGLSTSRPNGVVIRLAGALRMAPR